MTEEELRKRMMAFRAARVEYPSLSGSHERIVELEEDMEKMAAENARLKALVSKGSMLEHDFTSWLFARDCRKEMEKWK